MNQPILRTDLPYRLPDFGSATPDHFRAALEQGMSQQRRALADLRDDDSAATVENVLGAWEDAQATLRRACLALATVRLSNSSDELDALNEQFAPVLADHEDSIHLDHGLYARLQQLDQRVSRSETEADAQDRFALAELLKRFRRAGVCLPVEDMVGHAPDVQAFEVWKDDGTVAGVFLMDLWARPSKQGGAWMSSIVEQSHRDGTLPVVTNNCNFSPDTKTISWDQVITVFHEFGHALHGLLSETRYASRSGTNTPRDFVEFPSQVNEHWAWTPGRVLPAEWISRLEAAERFGQGYATAETELAALLDLAWHTTPLEGLPTGAEEVEAFERAALERYGLYDPLVPPRYRSQYFAHIWSGSYAASYYGYAWAKVMAADTVEWFQERTEADPPALTVREAGEHLRRTLLGPGGSVDAMETYHRFRGRDPELGALARRLGLTL